MEERKKILMEDNVLDGEINIIEGNVYYFGEIVNKCTDNDLSSELIRENYVAGSIAVYIYNNINEDYDTYIIEFAPNKKENMFDDNLEYSKSDLYDMLVTVTDIYKL